MFPPPFFFPGRFLFEIFHHLDMLKKETRNPILSNWRGRNRILKISFAIGLIKGLIKHGLFSTVATKPHVAVEHRDVLV